MPLAALYAAPASAAALEAAGRALTPGLPTLLTSGKSDVAEVEASLPVAKALLDAASKAPPPPLPSGKEKPLGKRPGPPPSPYWNGVPGVVTAVYRYSGHLPHIDEKEAYVSGLSAFLSLVDDAAK